MITLNQDWWGLKRKRVLVFGAGGIGAAVVNALVELECEVACIDASRGALEYLKENVPAVRIIQADATDSGQVGESIDEASRLLHGDLFAVIHAIGVNDRKPVVEFSDDDWDRMLSVNLTSVFYVARAAAQRLQRQSAGRIVLFSSVAGRMAHKEHGPYAATKAGINQLAGVLANELAASGTTVNCIAPGYTRTALTAHHLDNPGVEESLTSLVPAGRLGTVEDIVGTVAYLLSERASYVTGEVVYIDGGRKLI